MMMSLSLTSMGLLGGAFNAHRLFCTVAETSLERINRGGLYDGLRQTNETMTRHKEIFLQSTGCPSLKWTIPLTV